MDDFIGKRRILEQMMLRTYIRWTRRYFLIKRGLVFIQLSIMGDYSFFSE